MWFWPVAPGVLLRRLQGDPLIGGVSHIIIDEIHERSLDSDFLLIIIRDLLPRYAHRNTPLCCAASPEGLDVYHQITPAFCVCVCAQAARPACYPHVSHSQCRSICGLLSRLSHSSHSWFVMLCATTKHRVRRVGCFSPTRRFAHPRRLHSRRPRFFLGGCTRTHGMAGTHQNRARPRQAAMGKRKVSVSVSEPCPARFNSPAPMM